VGSGLPLDNFNQYKTVFEKRNREGRFFLNLLITGDYENWGDVCRRETRDGGRR